jgi:hypothetical protein
MKLFYPSPVLWLNTLNHDGASLQMKENQLIFLSEIMIIGKKFPHFSLGPLGFVRGTKKEKLTRQIRREVGYEDRTTFHFL